MPSPAGAQELSMQVAGQQRTYIMVRPPAPGPLPTILFLHGRYGSADKMLWTGFGQLGEREGFVTVFPNGIAGEWNVFPPSAASPIPAIGADTAFMKELVANLVRRGIADPNRIYMSGISFGGFMTLRMACVAPELYAAIGVVSASMPDLDGRDCHPSKPLPLVMVNGTADRTVPYTGGRTPGGLGVWGTDRTLTFFRKLNGCNGAAQHSQIPQSEWSDMPPVVVDRWTGCTGAPIVLYTIIGGGHRAPGVGASGRGMGGFSTAEALWDFFRDKKANID